MGFEYRSAETTPSPRYDRADNKLIEYKSHDPSNSELYRYDSAYRLQSTAGGMGSLPSDAAFQRGAFADGQRDSMDPSSGGAIDFYQDWRLDGVGNWNAFFDDSCTTQTRGHSDFNEITAVGAATLVHDENGNMTDDGAALTLKWDALNRLREVRRRSDSALIAVYAYDARNRRMRKTVLNGGLGGDASLNATTDFYYDGWRVVEERRTDLQAGTDVVMVQYTYGNYLDEVWTRDLRRSVGGWTIGVDDLNDGLPGPSGEVERMFCLSNTLYSVVGLADEAGTLREAFQYDPYGAATRIGDGPDGDAAVNFSADDVRTANAASGFGGGVIRKLGPQLSHHLIRPV
jgi:hypothetical protein